MMTFSDTVQNKYSSTDTYHDGKWLMFDVSDDLLLSDIIQLLSIKKTPNRKLTRFGYCCDLCKAFVINIKKHDDRQQLADHWQKYYDLKIPFENIKCDGCLNMKTEAHRIDNDCLIRLCVMDKSYGDCSECDKFPCDKYMYRTGLSFEEANELLEIDLPSYYKFLCADDNKSRLERMQNRK